LKSKAIPKKKRRKVNDVPGSKKNPKGKKQRKSKTHQTCNFKVQLKSRLFLKKKRGNVNDIYKLKKKP